ncbi:MAG: hypothetical protein LBG27_01735 [Spirochaetaceae bacterium]|jgi:hypothetical protein|nr:hypothetical protein [Spirochaetaceae bacterium]
MNKKFFLFGMAALLSVSLFLTGCGGEDGTLASAGAAGAAGTTYLTGSLTSERIQHAIDKNAPLVFAGVTQSDNGTVIVPAGRNVELVGTGAYTVANNAAAILILGDAASVSGTGTIVTQAAGAVIAPQTVLDGNVTGGGGIPYQTIGTGGAVSGSVVAVKGPVSIAATGVTGTTIAAAGLSGKTLVVYGNLTVAAAVTAAAINVMGDITFGTGSIAVSTAKVTATGNLVAGTGNTAIILPAAAHSFGGITGTTGSTITTGATGVTVSGTVSNGTFATGAVINGTPAFTGTTSFAGTLANSAGATYTFNSAATVAGALTTGAALTIAGTGAVSVGAASTLDNGLVVTNTAGVTIPSLTAALPTGKAIDVSKGKVIFGGETGSVTLEKGVLNAAAGGSTITVAADGVITLNFSTTAASLELVDGGSVAIGGTGKVAISTVAELKGAGSKWTASGDTVTFAPTAETAGKIEGGTSATLTPSGTAAELYLLAASSAQALTISGTTKFTLDLSAAGKITFDKTTTGSTITLSANSDGIKLSESRAIVGTDSPGTHFTGAFVNGTGTYNGNTLNVSLVDGVITHTTTNDAKPEQIDKATTAGSLASSAS